MIPYRDENPSRTFPIITIAIIVVNVLAFIQEAKLGQVGLARMLYRYGLTPTQVTSPGSLADIKASAISFTTYMFLHGSLLHLVGNVWFLWIFGDNVEDRLGHLRFLVFYLLCGVVAGAAHMALNMHSRMPCVGASGAIAGVLGAYFILFPSARVRAIIPVFVFVPLFVSLPAVFFIGLWFILQLLSGMAATGPQAVATGTAWWAHIGGFIAGIFLVSQLKPSMGRPYGRSQRSTY